MLGMDVPSRWQLKIILLVTSSVPEQINLNHMNDKQLIYICDHIYAVNKNVRCNLLVN